MTVARSLVLFLLFSLVAMPVLAHVPSFPDDNTSPDRALAVPDATKSWSFYDRLDRGQVRYYRFSLEAGDRLVVGTFTPTDSEFTPSVVLMSPTFSDEGTVPAGVSVPEGMGALVVEGERPEGPSYELFAPSVNYHTVDVDRSVERGGTFLVAVYEPTNRAGQVGVVIGYREAFSVTEYVTVPFDLVQTHLWEGQQPLVVLGPWFLTVIGGLGLLFRHHGIDWKPTAVRYGLSAGSLSVLGTALGTAVQMALALSETGPTTGALVTSIYVVVPLLCGIWGLRVATRSPLRSSRLTRVGSVVVGGLSLVTWAGYIVGPVLFVAIALLSAQFFET